MSKILLTKEEYDQVQQLIQTKVDLLNNRPCNVCGDGSQYCGGCEKYKVYHDRLEALDKHSLMQQSVIKTYVYNMAKANCLENKMNQLIDELNKEKEKLYESKVVFDNSVVIGNG